MSRAAARALGLALTVLTAVVWLLLDPLAWPAQAYTTFLLVPLPALLLLQGRMADQIPQEDREAVYVSSAVSIWVLAAFAMLAARFSAFSRADLRLVELPLSVLLAAAGLTTIAGLAIMAAGKLLRVRETALLDYLLPRTSSERIAFGGLSVSAGIAEELVFRSFLIEALARVSGSLPLAVGISVAVFAVSHAYQGFLGAARVALLGLVLTVPYLVTGSVYPSIIAHAGLDLLAGLVLADWLRSGDG